MTLKNLGGLEEMVMTIVVSLENENVMDVMVKHSAATVDGRNA